MRGAVLALTVTATALGGCQLLAAHQPRPAAVGSLMAEPSVGGRPATSFVMLPARGSGDVRVMEVRPRSGAGEMMVSQRQIEAELATIIKRSKASGGPVYVMSPPPCIVDLDLQRELKTDKSVCYAPDDAGAPLPRLP